MTPPADPTPLGVGVEFDRIRRMLRAAPLTADGVIVPTGDDAAVLDPSRFGKGLVVSTDLSIEDVHFRRSWIGDGPIGFRAVTVALSDLAAMAATPVGVLVSLAIDGSEADPTEALGAGIAEACREVDAVLLGGDLTRSPGPLTLDVVVLGACEEAVTRTGARPGDEIWVTGVLGGAAGAVRVLDADPAYRGPLYAAYARPHARVREAAWLASRTEIRAMLDLSDGLGGDVGHLAAASGVQVVLDPDSLPVHPELERRFGDPVARSLALAGGEDYELCLALPEGVGDRLAPEFRRTFELPLTRVGRAGEGTGVVVVDGQGRPRAVEGFDHFSAGSG